MGIQEDQIIAEMLPCYKEFLPNLKCNMCDKILEYAVKIQGCAHFFCTTCLSGWIFWRENDETNIPCPECRQTFKPDTEIQPCKVMNGMLSVLQFKCWNEACKQNVPYWSYLTSHKDDCFYDYSSCSECNEIIVRKDLKTHTPQSCLKYVKLLNSRLKKEIKSLQTESKARVVCIIKHVKNVKQTVFGFASATFLRINTS